MARGSEQRTNQSNTPKSDERKVKKSKGAGAKRCNSQKQPCDMEIVRGYRQTQQDMMNHVDSDLNFAKDLEQTSIRVNRMMLRMVEKHL